MGETKAQNKQHSDVALKVITASDRVESTGFGPGVGTQPVIDVIPWPRRSLPFNESSERPTRQPGAGSWRPSGRRACICVCWGLFASVRACVCIDARLSVTTCRRFQSRISAVLKYLFSFGLSCLKKMSGSRIKSLSGGI